MLIQTNKNTTLDGINVSKPVSRAIYLVRQKQVRLGQDKISYGGYPGAYLLSQHPHKRQEGLP